MTHSKSHSRVMDGQGLWGQVQFYLRCDSCLCAGITGTVTWHPYRQAGKWQVNSGTGNELRKGTVWGTVGKRELELQLRLG